MFLKIFKYDFKAVFFKLLPIIVIVPSLAVVTRIANLINIDFILVNMIKGVINFMFGMSCAVISVYSVILSVLRYAKSLFNDQGYLTHTLPVSKHSLLLSQILLNLLITFMSTLLISVSALIAYGSADLVNGIVAFFKMVFEVEVDASAKLMMVLLIILVIVSVLQTTLVIFLGIALGHAHSKNKKILSVLYCIAINYGLGIVMIIPTAIFSLSLNVFGDALWFINIYLSVTILVSIGICFGAYFLNVFTMNRRLNLE